MSPARPNVLLIGYGNPSRGDDGLGPAFVEAVDKMALPDVTVESDYQLTLETAHTVSEHDVVIFVDADASAGSRAFSFRRLGPGPSSGLGSHGVEPQEVMELAQVLFKARVEAYVLGIRGYVFTPFLEGLSPQASKNLSEALVFIENVVGSGDFQKSAEPENSVDPSPSEPYFEPVGLN